MRLALLLLASLAVIGGIVWLTYSENQSSLARLEGQVLKVRTYPLDENSVLAIADFRVTNVGDGPFVVDRIEMELQRGASTVPGQMLTKRDIDQVFAYQKLSGPQYNDPLIVKDRVEGGATIDRMAVARFDLPESSIDQRQGLRLRIHEFDGAISEIGESQTKNK